MDMGEIAQKHRGLSYVGDENGLSRYTYFLEDRRVFDVLVDNLTPAEAPEGVEVPEGHSFHRIDIAMVDAPATTRQATKGLAVRSPLIDAEGMGYRIDSKSIRTYVQGREAHFLARLFVPPAA
jgi:hypothetical protein